MAHPTSLQFDLETQESPDMDVSHIDEVYLVAIQEMSDDPTGKRKWKRLLSASELGLGSLHLGDQKILPNSQVQTQGCLTIRSP